MRKWLHKKFDWFDCRFVEVEGRINTTLCRDCGLWEIKSRVFQLGNKKRIVACYSVMFGSGDFDFELEEKESK